MIGVNNNYLNGPVEQVQLQDPLQQANKTVEDLFQKTFLTEGDKKRLFDAIQSLPAKIKQSATEQGDSTSYKLMVDTMVKAKEIIDNHSAVFNLADQHRIKSIFSKDFIINGQNVSVDLYPLAQSLEGFSPIFTADLENNDLTVKDSPFAKQYYAIAAYRRDKVLPKIIEKNMPELFELFKAADLTGYQELAKVASKKILGKESPIADKLFQYALDSGNNELVMECLPCIIKNKSTEEIAEISKIVDKKLSQGWFFTIKDGATKGKLLQVQYETGQFALEDVAHIIEHILEKEGKKDDIPVHLITENDRSSLVVGLRYTPDCYELLKMLSQIKAVDKVFLGRGWKLDGKMKDITFPNVKSVSLFDWCSEVDLNFEQLVPNAKQYYIYPRDDEIAAKVLYKIPADITHLNFCSDEGRIDSVTDATASVIASRFKNLKDFAGWSEGTSITHEGFMHVMSNSSDALYKKAWQFITGYWS